MAANQGPVLDPGILRRAELFSSLLDDDLEFVSSRCEAVRLGPGERLFSRGEISRRLYVVLEGEISVTREGGLELARFVQGDAIGDFGFAISAPASADAQAVGEALVAAFPGGGASLEDLAAERPDAVARVLLKSMAMISARIRSVQRLISDNQPWIAELRRQIYADPGTGLLSRAFLDEELPSCLEEPTALVLIKPDGFKDLVETEGHVAADAAMTAIAGVLGAETARLGRGWPVRLRGNETCLVVPRCGRREAQAAAANLASGLAALAPRAFSSSAVVALWPEDGASFKPLLDRACALLARTWREGGGAIATLGGRS